MEILAFRIGQEPKIEELNGLKEMQAFVGGTIQCVGLRRRGVVMVCNDEGKINGMAPNRLWYMDGSLVDVIHGDFFVCGQNQDDLDDITQDGITVAQTSFVDVRNVTEE